MVRAGIEQGVVVRLGIQVVEGLEVDIDLGIGVG